MADEIFALSWVEALPDKAAEVQKTYNRPLSEELRKAGCTSYRCLHSLDKEEVFLAVGQWESLEAFQKHLQQNQSELQATHHLLVRQPELQILKRVDAAVASPK